MRAIICALFLFVQLPFATSALAEFRAGAAAVDVTPLHFPVLVNGGMTSNSASKAVTPLYARAIVLADANERIAIVEVDSCMMPRSLLDEAKQLASQRTEIQPNRMLISATHTHTAPASMGCLGTDADETYIPYLREKLAQAIAEAEANLQPARVGWAVAEAGDYTALRRWILRPDRVAQDPFGNLTVRANMHVAANLEDVTGESGPEDPQLSLISFQSTSGSPIALLANFSMHYFSGVEALHSDYFGLFCEGMQTRIRASVPAGAPPFVAAMSHGCSGDIWRRDYAQPMLDEQFRALTIEKYTAGLLQIAASAYDGIEYRSDVDLQMAQSRMELDYRVPDQQRLEWAQRIIEQMGDRAPQTTQEVYAREQLLLHERKSTEVVVQAIRIGDIAIATTPNETYALTGLKLKLQSPLTRTMVIELANGGDGYIPPPEQHTLGGYNTWPARSAGLEVNAEPKIVEAALQLLEQICEQPRRDYQQTQGPAALAIRNAGPAAYWRLDDFAAPWARDSSGHNRFAYYEPGVVFFLQGPKSDAFCQRGEVNRAAHFAGGRLQAQLTNLGEQYSVSLWFWNGMPSAARETTGWLYSHDRKYALTRAGEHIGIGGTATTPGVLVYLQGDPNDDARTLVGRTPVERWTWNHLLFVRNADHVQLFLNGAMEPEIDERVPSVPGNSSAEFFFGGRSDNVANWEGRLDGIAVFAKALDTDDVKRLAP